MRSMLLALPVLAAGLSPALAQETRYVDDRSSAASIVQSLYNAINRKEYARAWSYFGDTKPAKDFDTFAKGYATTRSVTVVTGNAASEGAAGSTYFSLPIAIESFDDKGGSKIFAGCYTARLLNPAIQDANFAPLHLEKGSLKPVADTPLSDAVPASCPDAPAPDPANAVLDQAQAAFDATHGECDRPGPDAAQAKPETYRITYRDKSDSESDPERVAQLVRFFCTRGAYNEIHVYYLHTELDGLRELHFATPDLDVHYADPDNLEKVESVNIIGYLAADRLVNSSYDEASHAITSASLWRGVGDASATGRWIFRNGDFSLVHYEVDASYDGEINPETLIDFETPP